MGQGDRHRAYAETGGGVIPTRAAPIRNPHGTRGARDVATPALPFITLTAFTAHAAMERELVFVRCIDALKEGRSIVAINIDTIEKAVYSLKGAPLILPVKPSL